MDTFVISDTSTIADKSVTLVSDAISISANEITDNATTGDGSLAAAVVTGLLHV